MFTVKLKAPDFDKIAKDLGSEIDERIDGLVSTMAQKAFDHIVDIAQEELKTLKDKYIEGLEIEQLTPTSWLISMTDKSGWIETGHEPGFQMLPGFLNSPKAKTAKDGSKYLIIPMEHATETSHSTQKGQETKDLLKRELSQRGVPFTGIENGNNGKPKLGTLHNFNFGGRQGLTGIPYLQGVRISQKQTNQGVKRSIMTWRTASSKQNPSEYWVLENGTKGLGAFDKTVDWIEQEWEKLVLGEFGTS